MCELQLEEGHPEPDHLASSIPRHCFLLQLLLHGQKCFLEQSLETSDLGKLAALDSFCQSVSHQGAISMAGETWPGQICLPIFTGVESSGCRGRNSADVCLRWSKHLVVMCTCAAVGYPLSLPFILVSTPQFSMRCCHPRSPCISRLQFLLQEVDPGWPNHVLTAYYSHLSDWQVSWGSICWGFWEGSSFVS